MCGSTDCRTDKQPLPFVTNVADLYSLRAHLPQPLHHALLISQLNNMRNRQ